MKKEKKIYNININLLLSIYYMYMLLLKLTEVPRNRHFFYQRGGPRPQQQQQQQERNSSSILYTFLQLLPLILLVFISLPSFTGPSYPNYSFSPTPKYSEEAKTYQHDVPYYYNPSEYKFQDKVQLKKFEQSVEQKFFSNLVNQCNYERRRQQARINNAVGIFKTDQKKLEEARKMRLYSCEKLREYNFDYY